MIDSDKNQTRRKITPDLIAVVSLFILAWAPFIARMVEGTSALSGLLAHDVGFQWIPFRLFILHSFEQGVFPLWSPQVFAGFPFAAFSHTGAFYPLGFRLLISDYASAVNGFYPLHLFIAGSGVYALCRNLGLRPFAAFFAALCYTFTGKPYYFIHFLPATCSNAWVPWLLFSALALLKSGRFSYFLMVGVFLSLQVLGGDVESTSYALVFSLLFIILVGGLKDAPIKRVAAIVSALALGLLLSIIQFLPLMEFSEHFIRNQGVTFSYFSQRRLPLSILWAVFQPVRGTEGFGGRLLDEPYFYLGVITIAMAGLAAWKRAHPGSRRIGLLAMIAFAWSFGSIPIIDRFQFLLPLLGRFGTPEHAYFMGQMFLAVLAGQGVQALREEGGGRISSRAAMAALLFCMLITLAGSLKFELLSSPTLSIMIFSFALALIFAVARLRPNRAGTVTIISVLALQLLDVYTLAFLYLPANQKDDFKYSKILMQSAGPIRASNSRFIMVSRYGVNDPELLYHSGLALDMDSMDGWITVPPRRYAELLALADVRAARFKDGRLDHLGINSDLRDARFIDADSMPILDLVSLRWIVDRGIPLKFSSPFFLDASPPEFHRRTAPDGRAAGIERIDKISPTINLNALIAGPNEIYTFRTFVNSGDRLVFAVSAFHLETNPSATGCEAKVEILYGNSADVLFQDTLSSVPSIGGTLSADSDPSDMRISRNLLENPDYFNVIDLSKYSGRETVVSFTTRGPEARPDLVFLWRSPVIVNESKPFQARARHGPDIMIYENREALPRAFIVNRAEKIEDREERLDRLSKASRYELSKKIFVERDFAELIEPGAQDSSQPGVKDSAVLESRRPGEEIYMVKGKAPGFLFVSDQYYPGWKAFVRGKEAPILRAHHSFRAVPTPAGSSLVRMVYVPVSFRIGLITSLISTMSIAAMFLMRVFRRRRSQIVLTRADMLRAGIF